LFRPCAGTVTMQEATAYLKEHYPHHEQASWTRVHTCPICKVKRLFDKLRVEGEVTR